MRRNATIVGGLIAATLAQPIGVEAKSKKEQEPKNILLIVADDLGVEALNLYNSGDSRAIKANTPTLDKMAKEGVVFDNLWGAPLSSPVRAAMLTGRYCFRTGVVNIDIQLPTSERLLHASLSDDYANSLIGKWHLSNRNTPPATYGVDYFAGLSFGGGVRDYNSWQLTQNGNTTLCTEYITTKLTDLALEWIGEQSRPWLCTVTYNAPHSPFHLPPAELHTRKDLSPDQEAINANPIPYFIAMIESLDHEIGRLLSSLPKSVRESTVVIFVGDNGSERNVIQSPYLRSESKGSVFEGGVRIPLIVSGAGVERRGEREDALVSATDIFATVMELSGETMPRYEDSYSFCHLLKNKGESLRSYSYVELSSARAGYQSAIRDEKYKLIVTNGTPTLFCTFDSDHTDGVNLLGGALSAEAQRSYDKLLAEVRSFDIDYEALKVTTNVNNQANGNRRVNANTNARGANARVGAMR